MNAWKHICGLAVVLTLAGCIPLSLNPIYTDDVLVVDPRLDGVFSDGENTTWAFKPAEDRAYIITVTEDEETWKYTAHLIQLKDDYFLDLQVEDAPGFPDDILSMQLVPAHTFFRLDFTETGLKLHMLDVEWLAERADRGRLWVSHVRVEQYDGLPVFTASPKRMQRFLRHWAHDSDVWTDETEVTRAESSAATS